MSDTGADAVAVGTMRLNFRSGKPLPNEQWQRFQNWAQRNFINPGESSKRVSGLYDEAQVSYTATFDTEQEFVNGARELVHSIQTVGRMPRSVYQVEAEYWLSSLQESNVPWYTTIDLENEKGQLMPQHALD